MGKPLYITARSEDWKRFKLFFSLEHQEIVFTLSYEIILNAIKRNDEYRIVYYENNAPIVGSKLTIIEEYEKDGKITKEHLSTIHNSTINDNLKNLPLFEIMDLKK